MLGAILVGDFLDDGVGLGIDLDQSGWRWPDDEERRDAPHHGDCDHASDRRNDHAQPTTSARRRRAQALTKRSRPGWIKWRWHRGDIQLLQAPDLPAPRDALELVTAPI